MSEIRIIHQQIQLSLEHSLTQSRVIDKLVENLKIGQILNAQIVKLDNKFWLMIENIKLPVARETIEQMELKENQLIRMRVKSISDPVELQIVKQKAVLTNQSKSSAITGSTSKPAFANINQQPASGIQTTGGSDSNKENASPEKTVVTDKINVDKLILEARKYLSKDLVSPTKNTHTIQKQALPQSETGKSNEIHSKTGIPSNSRTSETLQNVITQSRTVNNVNANKTEPNPATVSKQDQGTAPLKSFALQSEASNIRPDQAIKKQSGSATVVKPALNTSGQVAPKSEQLSTNPGNVTSKTAVTTEQLTIRSATKSTGQVSTKATESNPIITSEVASNRKQESISSKKMKLEIPVTMPDSQKFPLLSEKMQTAFQRLLPAQQSNGKSINNLFLQLQRLNQWTSDLKASGRTANDSQTGKLAADLKESLRDLFRYINHKDNLKTGKSIEKALRQSGTFLEKRVNAQQQVAKQGGQKSSNELTLHKDVKANLNRVLATTLYNLAKITASSTGSSSTTTSTATGTTSTGSAGSTTGTTTMPNQTGQTRQLTGSTSTTGNNLIQTIRKRLQNYRGIKTNPNLMPELERITREVLKNVQSALIRSQLGQLTNLRPETAPQQWLFELPVMNNKEVDTFLIQFTEQETKEEKDNSKKGWSLILQFDIAPLGKLRAMLIWQKEKIKVRFLAEQRTTAELVSNELNYFQNVLGKQGLSFEELTVEQSFLDDIDIQFSRGNANA